jgi:hypothetical protein
MITTMSIESLLLLVIGALLTTLSASNRVRLGRIEVEMRELVGEKNINRIRITALEVQQKNTDTVLVEVKVALHEINVKLDDIAKTCATFTSKPHP